MRTIAEIVNDQIDPEAIERRRVRESATVWLERWSAEHELPPGVQGSSIECVFARALGGSWSGQDWVLPEDRLAAKLGFPEVTLPPDVKGFIRRFDAGEYPDLIEGGS